MKRAIFLLAFAFSGAALGQEGPATAAPPAKTLAPQVHTEIRLFLTNGDKITGIVKNNRFCEKPTGKDFVAAQPEEKGSGLRLFFIHDTKSYVFFPKEKYTKYERVRGLTDVQFRDLSRSMDEALNKKPDAEAKPKDEKSAEKKAPTEEEAAAAKKKAQEAEWLALLERFSPEAGWGEERYQKLQRNRVNGVYPNSEESEFEKQYANWRQAFDWLEAERAKQALEEERKAKEAEATAKPPQSKG